MSCCDGCDGPQFGRIALPNNPTLAAGTPLDIGAFNTSDQNPLLVDTCGTWLLFNNLFGVTPFVDFCKVTGNVCNEQGATPGRSQVCPSMLQNWLGMQAQVPSKG